MVEALEAFQIPVFSQVELEQQGRDYLWHATITGNKGQRVISIKERGLLPKGQVEMKGGSAQTPEAYPAAYATTSAKNALRYLKNAADYDCTEGGLPLLVVLKINTYTLEYSYDTDILAAIEDDPYTHICLWYAFIRAYITIGEFIEDKKNEYYTGPRVIGYKQRLMPLYNKTTQEAEKEIWNFLRIEASKDNFLFYNATQLRNLLKSIDPRRWGDFIRNVAAIKNANNVLQNLLKYGGWDSSYVYKMFVISPAGDKNWLRWAELMPRDQAIIMDWENWDKLEIGGVKFPGKGRLVKIYP